MFCAPTTFCPLPTDKPVPPSTDKPVPPSTGLSVFGRIAYMFNRRVDASQTNFLKKTLFQRQFNVKI